jgi:hypothetical protein
VLTSSRACGEKLGVIFMRTLLGLSLLGLLMKASLLGTGFDSFMGAACAGFQRRGFS